VEIDVVVDADAVGEEGEAELTQWLVSDGTHVSEDELIAEIETSKALLEIRAPAGGRLRHVHAEGDVVEAGAIIARIDCG